MRRLAAALAFFLAVPGLAAAAELVMFETDSCPWCRKWHREVGAVYPASDEGRRLPLRRVETRQARPADLAGFTDIKYVPTFVVLSCGAEAGRIVGFNDEAMFWGELDSILARVGHLPSSC